MFLSEFVIRQVQTNICQLLGFEVLCILLLFSEKRCLHFSRHSVGGVKLGTIRPRKFCSDKLTSLFRVAYHTQCSGDSLSARYLSVLKFSKKKE